MTVPTQLDESVLSKLLVLMRTTQVLSEVLDLLALRVYNYGLVGSQPNYPDPYNRGLVGDKPNYKLQKGSPGGGGLGSIGGGSKPAALHTEYAEGSSSSSKAYGTQDIVFYIQRAGGGGGDGPEEGGQPSIENGQFEGLGTENIEYDTGVTNLLVAVFRVLPVLTTPTVVVRWLVGKLVLRMLLRPFLVTTGALLGTLSSHFETK